MRVLVTGGSGFIGGAVAERLAADHTVLGLSRSEAGDDKVRARGAEPVRGDLLTLSPGDLPPCDAVVHCAAWVEPWGTREDYWRANVEGTDRVVAAARAAGARRLVHISTEAVLWHGQPLRDVDESYPYPDATPYLYAETKAEAERRVRAANEPGGLETVVLRPRLVWGPGDGTIVPAIREMVDKGAFVWLDGGRAVTSTTHVDNLVHAVELALEKGRGGEVYFVTDGETTDFRRFLVPLLAAHGVVLPERSLPSLLVRPAAALLEGAWRRLGLRRPPPLTRHAVDLMCCDCTVRDDKARRELGYAPVVTVEAGLRALADARPPG
jgi:nucleoside-diphosphate-sugar epimerase